MQLNRVDCLIFAVLVSACIVFCECILKPAEPFPENCLLAARSCETCPLTLSEVAW